MKLSDLAIVQSRAELGRIADGKVLINTINAHSYNTAQKDADFARALSCGDYLIPDGISIVKACRWLGARSRPQERIAGWDLFVYEMGRAEARAAAEGLRRRAMFVGSSQHVLDMICKRAATEYPHLDIVTYSPPYKKQFAEKDNTDIIDAVNSARPHLLWIGMTAPKQEKWAYSHWRELQIDCHCGTIGAVFDFYAGTIKRAPQWWQRHGLEWLYRLAVEPRRMWRRYLIGNVVFLLNIIKEKRWKRN